MKNIREFFWPLLDKATTQAIEVYTVSDIIIQDENLDKALDQIQKIYDAESVRSSSIESKSSLFIGTLSVVTTIVLAVTTTLINSNDFSFALFLIIISLLVLVIYMVRTIWFSIKVLERKGFHLMFFKDYLISDSKDLYTKNIIVKLINNTNKNIEAINGKVNNMAMAQEYFKRSLVVFIIYSGLLVVFFLQKFSANINDKNINLINSIYLSSLALIFICTLCIVSIIINIILLKIIKKITNQKEEGDICTGQS